MKEKFFYLEKKYPQVRILINNTFGQYKGNLYSLYVARNYMSIRIYVVLTITLLIIHFLKNLSVHIGLVYGNKGNSESFQ
mgnify:CR=1 FL=1